MVDTLGPGRQIGEAQNHILYETSQDSFYQVVTKKRIRKITHRGYTVRPGHNPHPTPPLVPGG